MLNIITGPVNSGKSTRLFTLYKTILRGDGFYNVRMFQNGCVAGQNLIRMSTGAVVPFSRTLGHMPDNWDEAERFADFSFSGKGLGFAYGIMNELAKSGLPAFIDELGPLELRGGGLCRGFSRLLHSSAEVYAVCRDTYLKPVLEKFNIREFRLI